MFDSYNNLSPDYVPNNSSPRKQDTTISYDTNLPYKEYNLKGTFIGYSWNYGDTFSLTFDARDKITINKDSIVYKNEGECPTETTQGLYSGHKAYNLCDSKSWTLQGVSNGYYIWKEDESLSYPVNGDLEVYINRDMTDKVLSVEIFNFRWEKIHTFTSMNAQKIVCDFNSEISNSLLRGLYYCVVKVCSNDGMSEVINKATLIVK